MRQKNLSSLLRVLFICAFAFVISLGNNLFAKRNFTFDDAMKFESLRSPVVSNNGKWFAYEAKQDRGDVVGSINSTEDSSNTIRVQNGRGIVFSNNSEWAAMIVGPSQMEVENLKTEKKPVTNNSIKIINLNTKKEYDAPDLDKFKFSENSKWIAFLNKEKKENKPKMEKFKDKKLGNNLILRHLASGTNITIPFVTEFIFDTTSTFIFYTVSSPDGKTDGVYCRELNKEYAPEKTVMTKENTNFSNIAWSTVVNRLAFLSSALTEKGKPDKCNLHIWNEKTNDIITPATDSTSPDGWFIPDKNTVVWAKEYPLLYFGFKPLSEKVDDPDDIKFTEESFYNQDTLLAKSEVFVWHWNDPYTIPQQQNQWEKWRRDQHYAAVYDVNKNSYIQLEDTLVPNMSIPNNPDYAIAYSYIPYRKETTWYGDYEDIYCINLKTGKKNKVVERIEENGSLSNSGKYIVYYKDKNWHLYNTSSNSSVNITEGMERPFYDLFQDVPSNIWSCGFGGWVDDDKGFFLYDNYDIFYFETANLNNYKILTKGIGKEKNIKFSLRKVDAKMKFYNSKDNIIVHAFDKSKKNSAYYIANLAKGTLEEKVKMDRHHLRAIRKVKDVDKLIFTLEQYDVFPNYWISDMQFNKPKRISHLNLDIKDKFNWGTTELFEWSYKDTTLQGYIVKPDDYTSSKKYPVFVYFYDQWSPRMNIFDMPGLGHRPMNQVYMDNYIMFFVDIKYGVGSPGKDALECILSGCRALAKAGIVDTNKSCIQGHSWGGYQTAYIATQTDFFSAACAGAPVGNMTSAYSGIRLGSGRVRQFQYEAQQSRIGGNLFDSLDAYIRNSPVFFANKAKTPLLIGFGDIDECVPWEQGVELYMAMRRAQAPAIMLHYANEPHWQGRYWNKLDYSVKMKEFFDHYVLGKEAPEWITKGKPYRGEKYKKY